MKNIGASVSAVPAQEKKEAEVEKVVVAVVAVGEKEEEEEEEYHQMENEMIFCLEEAPEYQISAVGKWCVNTAGQVIGDAETYFLHVITGQRCESVWECLIGWSEPDEESMEKWETLCSRIEKYGNLEETICDEKRVEV